MNKDFEAPKLFTIKEFAQKNHKNGNWPDTINTIRKIREGSPQNGFENVFVKTGKGIFINEKKFWETVPDILFRRGKDE